MAKKHRGRIQAQGGGTEKSESWSQDEPLSKADGLNLLRDLENQLTDKERQDREKQLADAQRFIENAQGVDAPTTRIFRNLKHKRSDIRIDIEVIAGTAFMCVLLALIFLFLHSKS
jgi:hypothetical protein